MQSSLLSRFDTKFLLDVNQLADFLAQLRDDYAALDIGGTRLFTYNNLYLDTLDLQLFKAHQRGKYPRHKLRYRHYVSTDDTFLELKTKTQKRQTVKRRRRVDNSLDRSQTVISSDLDVFNEQLNPNLLAQLVPALTSSYLRVSLASKRSSERLTLDLGLAATTGADNAVYLSNTVIAELKQPKPSYNSPFMTLARRYSLRQTSFSKYAVSCCYLYPHLKQNRFKPVLTAVDRLES